MPSLNEETAYWRSLDELADKPEVRRFVENEFPSRAGELIDPLSRRRFMQVMGASLAMAGLTGCDDFIRVRWPEEPILPFAQRPSGRHPGTPVAYATAMELQGVALGLLVKSVDGRPVKVEGNPAHPDSVGATDAYAQASLLQLYDPDRSRGVYREPGKLEPSARSKANSTWGAFNAELKQALEQHKVTKGEDLFVLSEASSSTTQAWLRRRLQEVYPKLTWVEWEPLGRDTEWEGTSLAFGEKQRLRTHLNLRRAKVVVALDSDLLGQHPSSVRHSRDFMDARRAVDPAHAGQQMNRLWSVESVLTVTGAAADHRLGLASSRVPRFATWLARLVLTDDLSALRAADEVRQAAAELIKGAAPARLAGQLERASAEERAFLGGLALDLVEAEQGSTVISVGSRQPAGVHALGHLLNQALGNAGRTVTYTDAIGDRPSFIYAMQQFTGALKNSQVGTLLILGGNPVVDVPHDLDFAGGLARAGRSIHLGPYLNETALACHWHLPRSHWLESWGDARGWDGTRSVVQPLIAPIWDSHSPIELLSMFLGEPRSGYDLVRAALEAELKTPEAEFEKAWRRWLHDGVIKGTQLQPRSPAVRVAAVQEQLGTLEAEPPALGQDSLELVLTQDSTVYDGRFANNAWLQELPDPITKLTWDNALLISPWTGEQLGLETGDMATVGVGSVSLSAAVMLVPGMPAWSGAISLGYPGKGEERQKAAGVVARGTGFDAYPLRKAGAMSLLTGVTVRKEGKKYVLAVTQDHWAIMTPTGQDEVQRRITGAKVNGKSSWWLVREGTLADYKAGKAGFQSFLGPDPRTSQLWKPPIPYGQAAQPYRWAMAIDLNACTGCSTCVVACQAENNIPVVGKSEVERGREMHWLRIDRYFRGDPRLRKSGEPEPLAVIHQPVPCMQCENAPCEAVCPVAATTHSTDGLNDMAYNRCIGTRYCSNNCPYKVRRFNWFWNHHGPFHPRSEPGHSRMPKPPELTPLLTETEKMYMNPDVTVRSRGVMEKCTYCVQRIKAVTIPLLNQVEQRTAQKRVPVPDGAIMTACQQACPTRAIVFGDLEDPQSEVSKLFAHQRTYEMLAELNTRPRTRYMAKLRNPRVEAHTK